jgi:hypothetical protein
MTKNTSTLQRKIKSQSLFSADAWRAVYGSNGEAVQREREAADRDREFARAVSDLRRSWAEKTK